MLKNEVIIQFSIQGFNIDPSKITNFLELQPSKIWIKGEPKIKQSSLKYKNNGWEIVFKKNNICHIDSFLEEMIIKLSAKKRQLISMNNVEKKISIIVYSMNLMPSFIYNNEVIAFLHETNITLEHDIYCIHSPP